MAQEREIFNANAKRVILLLMRITEYEFSSAEMRLLNECFKVLRDNAEFINSVRKIRREAGKA